MSPSDTLPLLALVVWTMPVTAGLLQRKAPQAVSGWLWLAGWLTVLASGVALPLLYADGGSQVLDVQLSWLRYDATLSFNIGLRLDGTSALFMGLLAVIAALVAAFSEVYLAQDPQLRRYRLLLGAFTSAMAGLVLAADLLQIFVFWELVGATSFALIGFWHTKPEASSASLKAFILNRIGDAGLLSGILILISAFGTAQLHVIVAYPQGIEPHLATTAGLCLLLGAAAKSAQVPLQVWLPDAMAGPTSASALIHAATMVAAGVYLLVRVSPLLTETVLAVVAIVGSLTALLAALSALVQTDIKRILAYSTVSQLGLMVAAVGFGAPEAAFFHLVTHAFFKSGLFLSAGALFTAAHNALHHRHQPDEADIDVQDIRHYGGLFRLMPRLSAVWLVFSAALIGLPFTAGFLSKETIWSAAFDAAGHHPVFLVAFSLMAAVLALTGIYTTRMAVLLFSGKARAPWLRDEVDTLLHTDAKPALLLPLFVLSAGALWLGYSLNPLDAHGVWLLSWLPASVHAAAHSWWPLITALAMSLTGVAVGLMFCRRGCLLPGLKRSFMANLLYRHFYWDDTLKTLAQALPDEGHSAADRFLAQHFFWDKALRGLGRRVFLVLAAALTWLDRHLVDGLVRAAGSLFSDMRLGASDFSLGAVANATDRHLVDGVVQGIRGGTLQIGSFVRRWQNGRLQTYLLFTLLLLGLLAVALLYFLA